MKISCFKSHGLLSLASVIFFLTAVAGAAPPQLVSRLNSGQPSPAGGNGDSALPILSADGRYILFASTANNLVLLSNNIPIPSLVTARFNVYLRDRTNQTTTLVSFNTNATAGGNGDSMPLALSTNGQFALFESSASNLVAGDTNSATDVFLRDLTSGTTLLVSINTNGIPGNRVSRSAVMTPDGRYVAFVSEAFDLIAQDTNKIADVFVRDMQALVTTLASPGAISTNPAAAVPASSSESPQITPDGRWIAFSSTATNLVPGVLTVGDIYVCDRLAGTNLWASSAMRANLQTVMGKTNGTGYNLALSADGKFVAYEASIPPSGTFLTNSGIMLRFALESGLTDLIHTNAQTSIPTPEATRNLDLTADGGLVAFVANSNGVSGTTTCVQVWDAATGLITLASGDLTNAVTTNSISTHPVLDSTGRFVVFLSSATGLVSNTVPGDWHLYLHDLLAGTTALVDADTNGAGSPVTAATVPSLSADGRYVAFESADSGLVPNDNNHALDVFVRDLVAGTNELISVCHPALASATPNAPSILSAFSASSDGRYLAFASDADNLAANDTNGFRDVFVRDLATGTNTLVSTDANGLTGSGVSFEPAISGDGRFVAFTSGATNLVAGDTNQATDVFVRDLQSGTTVLASLRTDGAGAANSNSYSPVLSTDGRWLLFRSQAKDLASATFSGTENLFLRDLQSGTNTALTTAGVVAGAMTPSGRFVAFVGKIPGVSTPYLYVWDSTLNAPVFTNTTTAISNVVISPSGNRLAYHTAAELRIVDFAAQTNWLVSGITASSRPLPRFNADGNWLAYSRNVSGSNQVFLYDVQGQTEQLISHADGSSAGGGGSSDLPDLTPDGRFVTYRTLATNIVAGVNGIQRQIVLYDRLTGSNTLVSASRFTGGPADDHSMRANFSADGKTLLMQSWASDLVPGDFNRSGDVFAYTIFMALILPPAAPGQGPWISWPFVPGNNYGLEFKNNLTDPSWQPLPGGFTNGGVKAWQQDAAPNSARRFYRVVWY